MKIKIIIFKGEREDILKKILPKLKEVETEEYQIVYSVTKKQFDKIKQYLNKNNINLFDFMYC